MAIETITIWQRVPLSDGTERIVALSDDDKTLHVAKMSVGSQAATSEISFELADVMALAKAAMAGNSRALTTPGLARMLCATVLVLGVAAFRAGGLQALEAQDDDGGIYPDRGEAASDGADNGTSV